MGTTNSIAAAAKAAVEKDKMVCAFLRSELELFHTHDGISDII